MSDANPEPESFEPENDLQAEILKSVQAQMAAQQQDKPKPKKAAPPPPPSVEEQEEAVQMQQAPAPMPTMPQQEVVQVHSAGPPPSVQQVQFAPITGSQDIRHNNPLDLILNVEVQATVELGRANMQVRDVLELGPGSVVELQKLAGEPVDVLVNNRPFARGEVVVIDECFGVRVTEIVTPTERIASLG